MFLKYVENYLAHIDVTFFHMEMIYVITRTQFVVGTSLSVGDLLQEKKKKKTRETGRHPKQEIGRIFKIHLSVCIY